MNTIELSDIIERIGFRVKIKTRKSVIISVSGNRIESMRHLANSLSHIGAKINYTPNSKSSIGCVAINDVHIYIKSEKRSGGLDIETKAISDINSILKSIKEPITIKTNASIYADIVECVKTKGTPKSDFHLINSKLKPVLHISHKAGSTPKDFQQWGGLTEKQIVDHEEVKKFIENVKNTYGSEIHAGESAFSKIKDKSLADMSVYGVNCDKGVVDVNRVDVVIQGNPSLKINKD
jgi:hypothetical protein